MARFAMLFALVSSTAFAQGRTAGDNVENAQRLADPRIDYAAYLPEVPQTELVEPELIERDGSSHGARVTYQVMGAAAGLGLSIGMAAAVGTAVGGESFNPTRECDDHLELCSPGGFTGFLLYAVSSPFLAAAGVTIAGNASGADGGYGGAVIGGLLGSSLGWLSFAKLDDSNAGRALQPVLTIAGSMIGYEISRLVREGNARRRARLMPTASASIDGFTLGISGTL